MVRTRKIKLMMLVDVDEAGDAGVGNWTGGH